MQKQINKEAEKRRREEEIKAVEKFAARKTKK